MTATRFDQAYRLHRAGQVAQALELYRALAAENPADPEVRHLIAVALLQSGRPADAVDDAMAAVEHAPDHPKAWNTLGAARNALGDRAGAIAAFRRAALCAPDLFDPVYNLANLLSEDGDADEALALFEQAAGKAPSDPRPWNNIGVLAMRRRRFDRAEQALRRALALQPEFHDAAVNLGIVLTLTGRPGKAAQLLRGLPETPAVLANLGNALELAGDLEQAVAVLRRAVQAAPDEPKPHQNLLVTIPFMDSWSAAQVAEEHRAFGRRWDPVYAAARKSFAVSPDPDRVLRVGYVSPNLCKHVLAQYMAPLFRFHHRDQVHVSVYAHVPAPDAATDRMRADVDSWTFIDRMSDDQVADQVRRDRIDVLVHPMGHWSENRIMIFARKPAPVQISYLCNSPTTGLAAFDGLIVDRHLDFDGALSRYCVEPLIHLPGAFQVAQYDADVPIGPPPCLTAGFVTFASFNNPAKLSGRTMDLWASVLERVPGSRLLIKGGGVSESAVTGRLSDRLHARGIAADRVRLVERVASYRDHLAMFNQVDVMLDTTPFTGGCTTLDALWMGVPVATLTGDAVYGRFSRAMLHHMGAPELVADDPDAYAALAAELALSPRRLDHYRRTLRAAMKNSAMMDFDGHCRDLENAYRSLWRRWCSKPETLS